MRCCSIYNNDPLWFPLLSLLNKKQRRYSFGESNTLVHASANGLGRNYCVPVAIGAHFRHVSSVNTDASHRERAYPSIPAHASVCTRESERKGGEMGGGRNSNVGVAVITTLWGTPFFSAVTNILKTDVQDLNSIIDAHSLGSTIPLYRPLGSTIYLIHSTSEEITTYPMEYRIRQSRKYPKMHLQIWRFTRPEKVYILDCISI